MLLLMYPSRKSMLSMKNWMQWRRSSQSLRPSWTVFQKNYLMRFHQSLKLLNKKMFLCFRACKKTNLKRHILKTLLWQKIHSWLRVPSQNFKLLLLQKLLLLLQEVKRRLLLQERKLEELHQTQTIVWFQDLHHLHLLVFWHHLKLLLLHLLQLLFQRLQNQPEQKFWLLRLLKPIPLSQ